MAILIKRSDLGRKDPPPDAWPGRDMSVMDVVSASGDERDWFSLQHRLDAFTWIQEKFWKAYKRRRTRRFDPQNNPMKFGQIMVVGDLGAGKSVLTMSDIIPYVANGHPFFHNGPWLCGRRVEGSSLYNIIGEIPRFSIVAYDETHVSFGSGMTSTTGVQSWDSDTGTPGFGRKTPGSICPPRKPCSWRQTSGRHHPKSGGRSRSTWASETFPTQTTFPTIPTGPTSFRPGKSGGTIHFRRPTS